MKKQEGYAELYSCETTPNGATSHMTKFSSLEEARKALEKRIKALQKNRNCEVFRDEVAVYTPMQMGDISFTLYDSSIEDDEGDDAVEFVIVRPKKGKTK